jgi:uncharacterized membrane protein YkvA (DUF1232 family)
MPTRLDPDFNRSVSRIDMSPVHSGIFTPGLESIEIVDDQVERFNDLAHLLNDDMPAMSADQLAGVARRVLRTAAAGGQSPFIRSRLRRASEMRSMVADPAWPLDALHARRIDALLAYLDDPNGLIHDDVPVVGYLDDALLVDISMDGLRDELDQYAEFCRYRAGVAGLQRKDDAAFPVDRESWKRERDDELRLDRQLGRIRNSNYAAGAAERVFRVC